MISGFRSMTATFGNGDVFEECLIDNLIDSWSSRSTFVEVFDDTPSPRKKKRKNFRTFNRNANVRASKLDGAIRACEAHQRGLGANVIFSGWVGSRKYKVVTRNYNTYVEEVFWFHIF